MSHRILIDDVDYYGIINDRTKATLIWQQSRRLHPRARVTLVSRTYMPPVPRMPISDEPSPRYHTTPLSTPRKV